MHDSAETRRAQKCDDAPDAVEVPRRRGHANLLRRSKFNWKRFDHCGERQSEDAAVDGGAYARRGDGVDGETPRMIDGGLAHILLDISSFSASSGTIQCSSAVLDNRSQRRRRSANSRWGRQCAHILCQRGLGGGAEQIRASVNHAWYRNTRCLGTSTTLCAVSDVARNVSSNHINVSVQSALPVDLGVTTHSHLSALHLAIDGGDTTLSRLRMDPEMARDTLAASRLPPTSAIA